MTENILRGRAWVFGDDVDTDLIYHNKYLAITDPKEMAQYSFEYYPGKENFAKEAKPGDFVVAGQNFGCGSSREHAVYCLKELGIPVILAESYARIYYRNAVNNGYPVLVVPNITKKVKDGDELEVNLDTGEIKNLTTGEVMHGDAVTDLEKEIMAYGGLIPYLKAQAAKEQK
ncbi:3-isopropylmalate dehydratase, small subunit [Thermovirga lienii DSM 17291]|jgi:3-isopropylmalate/(R)-2-methylmalate dehydratase small subunit|uniref:3-isopropylmalate dehydratase small subunit n=1 Tax=Thermovirga lienii (strain ATCC BAA-1197 / DSM 17291 / Cas60314) TaxID=580340 RepID=G7V7N1_THELD|nr:3-isopropylmalate dehydratase small subunit [Thermovirga lienii]AER67285.1 3-isopropylmalate dehydratase, small subunit [Thermovirga lienii DSM 17291]MDN5318220.1 3-isopropylmalate/(R)-2-methylmalate dehydratase small subunit [Thermovirga sp.]MDN5367509.1 3-isopropylmalate/(R)-2-methylmalate dehydratase small subunit [Thermovirga sp.]HCD71302.1 3-isopropylmalate dehydratase small subunit [Thermovirga lienii]